ncbi:MAG TPA: type II toxin-antitoxin system VapC family toxin [Longimicrobium sp.]|uniref:type II toxin-antitoxin system VapC family toxin n=1 Tax=Longimicrobium sp. TaxID=2029185 RepID=UPI002EDA468F
MTTYFFDTSAVVRLYTTETGAVLVRNLVRSAVVARPTTEIVVCDLARPETFAALRKIATGADAARRGLSRAALRMVLPRVREDFSEQESFFVMPATPCMTVAAEIAGRHPIKGADAVHIASALTAKEAAPVPERFFFVSDDLAQCRVAEAEGLNVLRPSA